MLKHASILLNSGIQITLGIAFIGWGITYGYQNYQGDRCNDAFHVLAESNQVRLNNVQARIDKMRVREAAMQARVAEIAKTFNERAKDAK